LEKGLSSKYFQTLFEGLDATSRSSAQVIVPLVLELLQPRSVIDIGCGVGSWLAVFKECGVQDILGVDFDCVDRKLLQIPKEQFFPFDLKKPLKIERQFDLVLCLEVAGYIPDESAAIFVNSLTELGSAILFSAAVPLQDDPAIQVNQQWPEYWFSFFQQKGYIVIDCLRKKIWNNPDVAWWFAQNLLLFVRQDYLESQEQLQKEFENTCTAQLSIIHPQLYINMSQKAPGMKVILSALPVSALNAVKRRLGR
jgi:SAM-dependent methyltransferase